MRQVSLLFIAVFALGFNCYAQNESKFKSLKGDIAKSDAATQDAKKSINPKTWMDRGKLFQDAYGINVSFLRVGLTPDEAKMFFKDPLQILSSVEGGTKKETYEYSQIKLNFENGTLASWVETEAVTDDPLGKAISAYQKATSLDEKGKNTKKINEAYAVIINDLSAKAFNEYELKKYKDAYNSAEQRIAVNKLLGKQDTSFYYYAGAFALTQSEIDSSMWQQAADNLEKAAQLGFKENADRKGEIYHQLFTAYLKLGQPENALKAVKTGFEKNPSNLSLVIDLINYYMNRNQNQEALTYIDQAIAKEPKNAQLYFAKGKMLDELGEKEKAIEAYDQAIAADPTRYDSYYNKGVVFYNSALKLYDDANNASNAEFDAKMKIADEEFMKVIPLMEKALELNPGDHNIMDILKTLYYRLKTRYPELEAKYNDIVKKLEAK